MEKELENLLEEILNPIGFVKERRVWRRTNAESIDLVGLQKSSFGNSYYINLGVFFPDLEDLGKPLPQNCHIQTRLEKIHPDPKSLENLLDEGEGWKVESTERLGLIKWGFIEADKTFFGAFKNTQSAVRWISQNGIGIYPIKAPLYYHWQKHLNPQAKNRGDEM